MGMRSSAAVAKWLQEQEWYEAWVDNHELQEDDIAIVNWYKAGYELSNTLTGSIMWDLTPEGDEYWRGINEQFRDWFYGDQD